MTQRLIVLPVLAAAEGPFPGVCARKRHGCSGDCVVGVHCGAGLQRHPQPAAQAHQLCRGAPPDQAQQELYQHLCDTDIARHLCPYMLCESVDAGITFEVTIKSALYRDQSIFGKPQQLCLAWTCVCSSNDPGSMLATSVEHAAMLLHVGNGKESRLGKTQNKWNGCC